MQKQFQDKSKKKQSNPISFCYPVCLCFAITNMTSQTPKQRSTGRPFRVSVRNRNELRRLEGPEVQSPTRTIDSHHRHNPRSMVTPSPKDIEKQFGHITFSSLKKMWVGAGAGILWTCPGVLGKLTSMCHVNLTLAGACIQLKPGHVLTSRLLTVSRYAWLVRQFPSQTLGKMKWHKPGASYARELQITLHTPQRVTPQRPSGPTFEPSEDSIYGAPGRLRAAHLCPPDVFSCSAAKELKRQPGGWMACWGHQIIVCCGSQSLDRGWLWLWAVR